jgi:glutathione S-transferase
MVFRPNDSGIESADGGRSISNDEYRSRINAAGYVPVLVVDDQVVTEVFAIVTTIVLLSESISGNSADAMLGATPFERIRVTEWMAWFATTPHSSGYGAYLHPKRFVEAHDLYEAVEDKALKTILGAYDHVEAKLKLASKSQGNDGTGEATYAVGDRLTVVDFTLYILWNWGGRLAGITDIKEKYPTYGQLVKRLEGFEGVRKAVEEEGLTLQFE